MHTLLRRLFALLALALTMALAACTGGGQATTPSATAEPVAEAPTRTPRPTREPTAEPTAEPTEEPTEEPTARPTAAAGEVLPVEFADLQTFQHPSGVFSIDIPENWSFQDNSKPDEIIHVWTDPTRNGAVIVDIFEDDTVYTEEQLTDILRSFLENNFQTQPDFTISDPTTQNDGSILLPWSYTATADNDTPVELLGNSFIEQRENKVSILTTLVPADQFETTSEFTNEIINTYALDPSAVLSTGDSGGSGITTGGSTIGSTDSGELPATIVAIGETVTVGPDLTMTITGVEEPAGSDFFQPDAGNKFLIVRAVFANSAGEAQPVSTLLQMSLLDGSGAKYDIDLIAATIAEQTPDGEVPAGGTLEGGVGFQIPADAAGLVFVFNPLIDGEPVGVALD